MDSVIDISGQRFKNDPKLRVTVKRVLDVFMYSGRTGYLQQNGLKLEEHTLIDFNTTCPYTFIPSDRVANPQVKVPNSSPSSSTSAPAQLYRVVELEAAEDKFLAVNKIDVYDSRGKNVSKNTWLQSTGGARNQDGDILCTETIVVNNELNDSKNSTFRSHTKGGWIRLIFVEGTTLSKVVVKGPEQGSLMNAKLKLRTVKEHFIYTQNETDASNESAEATPVDTIELKASSGRPLRLSKLNVYDKKGLNVTKSFAERELILLKTSGLFKQGSANMSPEELLCQTECENQRSFEITENGAWLRVTFPHRIDVSNIIIEDVSNNGKELKGITLSLMATKSSKEFTCTHKTMQQFDIDS